MFSVEESMLETRPISACAKFKPVEQVKSEISSVKLIAELVEVKLQKVSLDVMIRVKNTSSVGFHVHA